MKSNKLCTDPVGWRFPNGPHPDRGDDCSRLVFVNHAWCKDGASALKIKVNTTRKLGCSSGEVPGYWIKYVWTRYQIVKNNPCNR